ncbi:MAG: hypothetical protein NVS1B5_15850 [Gemmatimonadaceae bacterium]
MSLRGAIILIGLWGVSPSRPTKTLLDGTAQLCPEDDAKGDTAGLRGVRVYAFDATKAQKILASLYTLDTVTWAGDEVHGMKSFVAEYPKLLALVKRTPKLGRATSNGNGDFEIKVPRVDSVLLFAEEELEDQPFFFASKLVATKGKSEVRVIIPMCNKRV